VTDDDLPHAIRKALDELVARVKLQVPGVLAVARYDGGMQPYASFAPSASDESLDLCVRLQRREQGTIECAGDLVRGGSGDVLGEMPSVTIRPVMDASEIEKALAAVRAFCSSQENRIVREMQAGP
jgi:hypothetical protein